MLLSLGRMKLKKKVQTLELTITTWCELASLLSSKHQMPSTQLVLCMPKHKCTIVVKNGILMSYVLTALSRMRVSLKF